jgi:hypothetical protein
MRVIGPAVLLFIVAALGFGLAHTPDYEPHRLVLIVKALK